MGAGGVTNRGNEVLNLRRLDSIGKPNSTVDRYKNGRLVQRRWYDEKGHAIRNRDYQHGGNFEFPHDHIWTWNGDKGERGEEHLSPDYENYR